MSQLKYKNIFVAGCSGNPSTGETEVGGSETETGVLKIKLSFVIYGKECKVAVEMCVSDKLKRRKNSSDMLYPS